MRKILRFLIIVFFLIFLWPVLIYKRYGENIKEFEGGSVVVANHYSNLDPILIYLVSKNKKKLYFITYSGVKNHFFTRVFCYAFHCLYVNDKDNTSNYQTLRTAIKLLKEGNIIVIFPEGVIRPCKNGFFEFNRGFIFLSRMSKGSIYPLFIYPEPTPFIKSKICFCRKVVYDEIKEKDDIDAAFFVQCMIIDVSFKLEKETKRTSKAI